MKQKLIAAGSVLLLLFSIKYPKETLTASREGMKLWLNTLLPTLLPFLILTGILIHTNLTEQLLMPFSRPLRLLLGLSPNGAYVCILGLLCGCPLGARLAHDLYVQGKLSEKEAEYLLTFCTSPSPAFLISYLGKTCLDSKVSISAILGILFLSNTICMLFFRLFFSINRSFFSYSTATASFVSDTLLHPAQPLNKIETSADTSGEAVIDVSIMNGFETVARLGGYILLFSMLAACIDHFWILNSQGKYVILGIVEITTGLYQLSLSGFPYKLRFLTAMVITASGGLCILAQTKSMLKSDLSVSPYILSRFLNAALTAIFVLIYEAGITLF